MDDARVAGVKVRVALVPAGVTVSSDAPGPVELTWAQAMRLVDLLPGVDEPPGAPMTYGKVTVNEDGTMADLRMVLGERTASMTTAVKGNVGSITNIGNVKGPLNL